MMKGGGEGRKNLSTSSILHHWSRPSGGPPWWEARCLKLALVAVEPPLPAGDKVEILEKPTPPGFHHHHHHRHDIDFGSRDCPQARQICKTIQDYHLTPKKFLLRFLQSPHPAVADRLRLWSVIELDSTMELIKAIVNQLKKKHDGNAAWETLVLDEAARMVGLQAPPWGNLPQDCYQSSKSVTPNFFGEDAKVQYHDCLVSSMPFLHGFLLSILAPW
ncbi:hypothetical protein VP01_825g3 [Puccinia sorghi]|uniref:Uncharacterized protein n=1 Tax=Puccinia sorghi TaxID=27349 RepID=A0A0L6UAN6_9BASI|nr:hypothetical protein VP01_825g3 [Puccinia sorghi]